jgi:hypothetical protein
MTAPAVTVYRCENEHCTLGSRTEPGLFSSGLTQEGYFIVTGNPEGVEGEDYGEGICPNCGKRGVVSHDETPAVGKDPYQNVHKAVNSRVLDPDDELTAEAAQDELTRIVEGRDNA